MARPAQPSLRSESEVDAFTGLVLRYLDGDSSAEVAQELKEFLASAGHREIFVQVCRLHGNLHETHAAKRAKLRQTRTGNARAETISGERSPDDTLTPPE